jgi:hypothetical protein
MPGRAFIFGYASVSVMLISSGNRDAFAHEGNAPNNTTARTAAPVGS